MQSWTAKQTALAEIATKQLFFVGGAPRSGTTWLQQILNAHPEISCKGEGLFQSQLTKPLESMIDSWRMGLEGKNAALFGHTGGYPTPDATDVEFLLGSAILLALHRQCGSRQVRAVGEKTPENVFFFNRLKSIFPTARLIAISRDPRDVLASAWHFFHRAQSGEDMAAAKIDFIRRALPSLAAGAQTMIELRRIYPDDMMLVTYEALQEDGPATVAGLFRFLRVDDKPEIVADCLARTEFSIMTGGRAAGSELRGSFFRKGIVGDWRSTLDAEMSEMILRELAWSFPLLGSRLV